MKLTNLFLGTLLMSALVSCGTDDNKQSPAPIIVQSPQSQNPAPSQTPDQPPIQTVPTVPTVPTTVETSTTTATEESAPTEQELAAYYDNQYTMQNQSNYNPESPYFYEEVNNLSNVAFQPYPNQIYVGQERVPFLGERYRQHRSLLNYGAHFNRARIGNNGWDRDHYDRTRKHFRCSIDWMNQIPQEVRRTLDRLEKRGFHSRHNYENGLRDAMSRRDHRSMVTMHDQILEEYQQSDNGNGDHEGRDQGQGHNNNDDGHGQGHNNNDGRGHK